MISEPSFLINVKKRGDSMVKSKRNVSKSKKKKMPFSRWHAVPLKGSFMLTAIMGFIISAYWVYPQTVNYGIAFMLIFAAMFVASLISMTHAPVPMSWGVKK